MTDRPTWKENPVDQNGWKIAWRPKRPRTSPSGRTRDGRRRWRVAQLQGAMRLEPCGVWAVPCAYCRLWLPEPKWTMDHVIPLVRGGKFYALDNLAIACRDCNHTKAGHLRCECGEIQAYRTYDRITWTETMVCAGCQAILFQKTRRRPSGAPTHMHSGNWWRKYSAGEIKPREWSGNGRQGIGV